MEILAKRENCGVTFVGRIARTGSDELYAGNAFRIRRSMCQRFGLLFLPFLLTSLAAGSEHIWPGSGKAAITGSVLDAATGEALGHVYVLLFRQSSAFERRYTSSIAEAAVNTLDAEQPPDPRAFIAGLNQQAILGSSSPPIVRTTDEYGRFEMKGIDPDIYLILAVRKGHASAWFGQRHPGDIATNLSLEAGQWVGGIVLHLMPGAAVSRRVRFEIRTRPAGAPLTRGSGPAGKTVCVRGKVLLNGMAPSAYYSLGLRPVTAGGKFVPPYPSTFGKPGKENFEICGVSPGSYKLFGNCFCNGHYSRGGAAVKVGTKDLRGLELELEPAPELKGRVRAERGARIHLDRIGIELTLVGGGVALDRMAGPTQDGNFVLHDVTEGLYRLYVMGPGEDFYVRAARLGDQEVLGKVFRFNSGMASVPLEILLSTATAQVRGVVLKDGRPWSHSVVALIRAGHQNLSRTPPFYFQDDPARSLGNGDVPAMGFLSRLTDQYGQFLFKSVPPGEYKLIAADPGSREVRWNSAPEFLRPYERGVQPIHLSERQHFYVVVELAPSDMAIR